ncbi:MAG: protease modulator HflK, partial [Candidatus Rokubacteria bacterium]|nr:protease modulator HflK [Candidatus Rokubacteria bacterium]
MAFNDERGQMGRWARGAGDWEDLGSRLPRLPQFSRKHILAVVIVILAIWLGSGFYIVGPGEQGVVRQFGK